MYKRQPSTWPRRSPGKINLTGIPSALDPGAPEKLELRLKKRARRALAAALGDGKRPKLTVTATGTDAAGNSATDQVTVKAKG